MSVYTSERVVTSSLSETVPFSVSFIELSDSHLPIQSILTVLKVYFLIIIRSAGRVLIVKWKLFFKTSFLFSVPFLFSFSERNPKFNSRQKSQFSRQHTGIRSLLKYTASACMSLIHFLSLFHSIFLPLELSFLQPVRF